MCVAKTSHVTHTDFKNISMQNIAQQCMNVSHTVVHIMWKHVLILYSKDHG